MFLSRRVHISTFSAWLNWLMHRSRLQMVSSLPYLCTVSLYFCVWQGDYTYSLSMTLLTNTGWVLLRALVACRIGVGKLIRLL
jgi:hypothetical protein